MSVFKYQCTPRKVSEDRRSCSKCLHIQIQAGLLVPVVEDSISLRKRVTANLPGLRYIREHLNVQLGTVNICKFLFPHMVYALHLFPRMVYALHEISLGHFLHAVLHSLTSLFRQIRHFATARAPLSAKYLGNPAMCRLVTKFPFRCYTP